MMMKTVVMTAKVTTAVMMLMMVETLAMTVIMP